MAAGLGSKTFASGDVLSAADVNGYLMQGVLVFASAAARDAAITAPAEGQYAYLKDTNATVYYDGAAWVLPPAGGLSLISTTTLSTITTTISSIPTTYKNLRLIIKDVKPNAAGQELFMRVNADTGNNYTTVSTYGTATAGSTNGYVMGGTTSVALSNGAISINNIDNQTFIINLTDYTDTTSTRLITTQAFFQNFSAAKVVQQQVAAYFTVGTAITSITIFMSGSTFATGTAYLYGEN